MRSIALTRQEVEARVSEVGPALRALGVERLALFGSVLRKQARSDSDVDLLVQFVPGQKTFDHFEALANLLEAELDCRVELVTREGLSPYLAPRVFAEAEDVFSAS